MDKRINISAISHIGNSRSNQEDNYLILRENYLTPEVRDEMSKNRAPYFIEKTAHSDRFMVTISDGMGGHSCGELASLLIVKYMSAHYDEIIASIKFGEKSLAARISHINSVVASKAEKNGFCRGMGATLCGVIANGYELVGFNVGDSRLYQFGNGKIKQLSTDHTEGQRLLQMQLLTEEEAKKFPRRKYLHKYIGYSGEIIPEIFRITGAEQGTGLLLCTDGLSDVISDSEIEQILNDRTGIKNSATSLVNKAVSRNPGYGDNITVILIEF